MPTANVYIDGFNLYYRCVKGTPYKWLNLAGLAAALLPPGIAVNRIRYFTARVRALPHDPAAPVRQQVYLRALQTIPNLTIKYGHFLTNVVPMRLANPPATGPNRVDVIKTDEKGSDVNLASYLLLDSFKKEMDIALIVSNDSDLSEPIRIVKREFGIQIGITRPRVGTPSVTLGAEANFIRPVRMGLLAANQFSETLVDAKGSFRKPATW